MAKQRLNPAKVAVPARKVRFVTTDLFNQTVANFKNDANVLQALRDFVAYKRENPLMPFGKKDYPFKGDGPLHGIGHAALSFDVRLVYQISGRDPHTITLYGVFTHDQMGTGNPPRVNLQRRVADAINRQTNVKPLEKIDESRKMPG